MSSVQLLTVRTGDKHCFRLREEGYQTADPHSTAEINQEGGVRVEFMWAR